MASIGVFTIASKNYLAYVRVLMASLIKIHPEYKLFLCLADRLEHYVDPVAEPYTIIEAEQIGIPDFNDFAQRYDIMELNTAVKPYMFRWLFNNTDLDAVIYLDPDIQVFSRFDRLESMLSDGASAVLTPHITRPLEDDKSPNDYTFLQTGVFNLGFITFRRCNESLDFIDWWERRLRQQCIVDFPAGLFVDQKWCDLAVCFLDNLKILRDVGYNAAYWNLAQRKVSKANHDPWLVNQHPLVFFHFSGVDPSNVRLVSKHQNRFSWEDIPETQPLFQAYNDALMQAGWKDSRNWPYAFYKIFDWGEITQVVKSFYRTMQLHPFDVKPGKLNEYLNFICNEPCLEIAPDNEIHISKLMFYIYGQRGDLQNAFSLDTAEGRKQFASWFEEAGPREYDLPPELTRQRLMQEKSDLPLSGENVINQASPVPEAIEPPIVETAKVPPPDMQEKFRRFCLALKSRMMRGF